MNIERIAEMAFTRKYKNVDELIEQLNIKLKELVDIRYERLRQKNNRLEKELHTFRSSKKEVGKKKYIKKLTRKFFKSDWDKTIEMLLGMKFKQRYDFAMRIILKDKVWKMVIVNSIAVAFVIAFIFMLIKIIYGG